jgi:exosome complex exonuclease RRP6
LSIVVSSTINGVYGFVMDPPASFQELQASIQSALVGATRTANQLASEDLAFHRTFDRKIGVSLDKQNARLLALAERLLHNAAEGSEVDVPKLRDADAVENNWRGIVDIIDTLLEKTDTTLDEFTGAVKRLTPREEQVRFSF